MSGIVDARGNLIPRIEIYQEVSWANFAQSKTTEIIKNICTILYHRIVDPYSFSFCLGEGGGKGGDAQLFNYRLTIP